MLYLIERSPSVFFYHSLEVKKLITEEIHRLSIEQFRQAGKLPLVVVLDSVRSMNNVGSVFRTADAYRIERILLCGITSTPPQPEIHKTALGAELSMEWQFFESSVEAVRSLIEQGYTVLAIEQAEGSVSLDDFHPCRGSKYAIVLGHEVNGVSQHVIDLCHGCIELPQYGTKHSLNVSVAAGIVIYNISREMIPWMLHN